MKSKKPKKPKDRLGPSEDQVYLFWKKYEEADFLDREKVLAPIVKNFLPLSELKDKKMDEHVLLTLLRSYFDDLLDYSHQRRGRFLFFIFLA